MIPVLPLPSDAPAPHPPLAAVPACYLCCSVVLPLAPLRDGLAAAFPAGQRRRGAEPAVRRHPKPRTGLSCLRDRRRQPSVRPADALRLRRVGLGRRDGEERRKMQTNFTSKVDTRDLNEKVVKEPGGAGMMSEMNLPDDEKINGGSLSCSCSVC